MGVVVVGCIGGCGGAAVLLMLRAALPTRPPFPSDCFFLRVVPTSHFESVHLVVHVALVFEQNSPLKTHS